MNVQFWIDVVQTTAIFSLGISCANIKEKLRYVRTSSLPQRERRRYH